MNRKIISVGLFMVLLTTALPVQQIGNWLANSGMSEEIACQRGPNLLEEHARHFFFAAYQYSGADLLAQMGFCRGLQFKPTHRYYENVLAGPIADILIPPPKC